MRRCCAQRCADLLLGGIDFLPDKPIFTHIINYNKPMRSPMLGWLITGIVILIVLLVWFLTIRNGQKLIEEPNREPVPYGMYEQNKPHGLFA